MRCYHHVTAAAAIVLGIWALELAAGPRPCDAQATPVVRAAPDAELVVLVGDVPAGGLFTDSRRVLLMRCSPAIDEPAIAPPDGYALCVRMEGPGQGLAETVPLDNWAWPVMAAKLTVKEQSVPASWNGVEWAERNAAARGARP